MKTLHVVISGLVQGVGFRYFTMRNARTLGIRGWVRNLPSGEVEVLAQGNDAVLEDFVRELRNGPGAAHVRSLRREWIEEDEMYDSFDMRGSS
ncbi:MAG: acylphosphatase [Bacteroidetes bacterium]|nr:acylphosphatase [Bacteroidota bacterium]